MYIPYSTKVQIKPILKHNPLLLKPELTNMGEVIAVGESVTKATTGQKVCYNPDANCIYGEYFFIDQEYIIATT
jgi:NADPH:quinone reductase-like Zn-dependent oxidoreductase